MNVSSRIIRRILCAALLSAAFSAGAAQPEFSEIVIETGFQVEQPVLSASLLEDGGRQIVLAGHDQQHRQRLSVHAIEAGSAPPILSMTPPANLIAYDVGRLGERDALYFIEPGRIIRYDFAARSFDVVTDIKTIYGQERTGEIAPIDFIRDVNDDERDDIVVADTAGYRVRLQRTDGSLGEEILLQESSSMTVSGGIVSFESRPLVSGDMNFDNLPDLAVWRGNSLRVYPQMPDDKFQGQPDVVPLGLDLLSETELRLRQLQTGRGAVDQSGLTVKRVFSIGDLNGDEVPDVLTEATLSEGVFDKRNEFRVHLGQSEGNKLVYRDQEDALLASEGLQFGLVDTDIDGDGKKDLVVRKVRLSFGRVIRALLSGNVSLQLQFFRMTDDDDYPESANYVAKTNVRFSITSGQVDIPAIKTADFDGDGLQDLMIQTDSDRLSFYHGVSTGRLFDKDAEQLDVDLPRNGALVVAEDIDDNGRADLIIRYNLSDGAESASTVRLLLARDWATD